MCCGYMPVSPRRQVVFSDNREIFYPLSLCYMDTGDSGDGSYTWDIMIIPPSRSLHLLVAWRECISVFPSGSRTLYSQHPCQVFVCKENNNDSGTQERYPQESRRNICSILR